MSEQIVILDPVTGELYEPVAVDPYALFGLEERAVLDVEELRRRYLALSRTVHPDRFERAGGEQLARASLWSTALNRAYRALSDTEARLMLLMAKAGVAQDAGTSSTPVALLAEVFELQELLEALESGPIDQSARAELAKHREMLVARMDAEVQAMTRLAERWDSAPERHSEVAAEVVACLDRRRYAERLLDRVDRIVRQR